MDYCNHCALTYDGNSCPICNGRPTLKGIGKKIGMGVGVIAVIITAIAFWPLVFMATSEITPQEQFAESTNTQEQFTKPTSCR